MSDKLQKIVDSVSELTVVEIAGLVKALEEKFGVTAAVVATAPTVASAEEGVVEQTSFNVIITSAGANKISVIKALREINPNLGLKEAKDLSETANGEVLTGVNKATAEEAKAKLVAAGAAVTFS